MYKKLHLQMHFNQGKNGNLIFKTEGLSTRINDLLSPLRFVANMKQLMIAIDTGAKQDCGYEIKNANGLEWVLNCRFAKGIVGLELWFQKMGFNEQLETLFDWQGSVEEFRKAVAKLLERLPRYRFFR